MKLVKDVIFRKVAGEFLLLPIGELSKEIRGLISLNESGVFLCNKLKNEQSEEDLVKALLSEYEVSIEDAKKGVVKFLEKLNENGLLIKE